MLAVSFDLLGHLLRNLTIWPSLMRMFNKSIAMKSEDANLAILLIPTEEILDLPMEVQWLALLLSKFLLISLTELGLFNGLGLEERLPWEIIIHASIIKSLEDLHS